MRNTVLLFCALAVSGCVGTQFDWSRAKQVQAGMTEEEITALMGGKPYMVRSQGDTQLWVWSYSDGFTGTRAVSFPMKNGIVASVPVIPF